MKHICIIIPAYNESATIGTVITSIHRLYPHVPVIVVNDGSTDSTAAVANEHNVLLISHTSNQGIGRTVQTGLRTALSHNFKMAIQCDADGQHDPGEMQRLRIAAQNRADLVIGNRYGHTDTYAVPLTRRLGARLCSLMLRLCFGQTPVSDPTSGFRLYSTRAMQLFAKQYPQHLPEPEAIALARKNGLSLAEVPVRMYERQGGASSVTTRTALFLLFAIPFGILWIACTGNIFLWPHERTTKV